MISSYGSRYKWIGGIAAAVILGGFVVLAYLSNRPAPPPVDISEAESKSQVSEAPVFTSTYTITKPVITCTQSKSCYGSIVAVDGSQSQTLNISHQTTFTIQGKPADIAEIAKQAGKTANITTQNNQATAIDIR